MLDISQVNEVVSKAAAAAFERVGVSRVDSTPTTDSDGREALNVIVVLKSGRGEEATGEDAVNAIVRIGQDLWKSGEERLPIIEFATEEEMDSGDDTES
jgi:hypothetical protein